MIKDYLCWCNQVNKEQENHPFLVVFSQQVRRISAQSATLIPSLPSSDHVLTSPASEYTHTHTCRHSLLMVTSPAPDPTVSPTMSSRHTLTDLCVCACVCVQSLYKPAPDEQQGLFLLQGHYHWGGRLQQTQQLLTHSLCVCCKLNWLFEVKNTPRCLKVFSNILSLFLMFLFVLGG